MNTSPTPSNVPTDIPLWCLNAAREIDVEYKVSVEVGIAEPSELNTSRIIARHAPALPGSSSDYTATTEPPQITITKVEIPESFKQGMEEAALLATKTLPGGVREDAIHRLLCVARYYAGECVNNDGGSYARIVLESLDVAPLTAPKTNDADSLLREFADVIRFGGSPERVKKLEEYLAGAPKTLPEGGADPTDKELLNFADNLHYIAETPYGWECDFLQVRYKGTTFRQMVEAAYYSRVATTKRKSALPSPTKETNI